MESARRTVLASASRKKGVWQASLCMCATVRKSGQSVCTMCAAWFPSGTWCGWPYWTPGGIHLGRPRYVTRVVSYPSVPDCTWVWDPSLRVTIIHNMDIYDSFAAEMLVNSLHLIPKHFWDISVMLVSNHCLCQECMMMSFFFFYSAMKMTSFCALVCVHNSELPRVGTMLFYRETRNFLMSMSPGTTTSMEV